MLADAVALVVTPILVALIGVAGSIGVVLINRKLNSVHVLVNQRMTDALKRIDELETKMGLASGEAIPSASIMTTSTEVKQNDT